MSKALVLRRGVGAESLAEVDNSLPQIFNLALWNFIHMDLVMEIGRNTDPETRVPDGVYRCCHGPRVHG